MNNNFGIYENLHWFGKKDESHTFYYLPLNASPEIDPQGRPTLSLMVYGRSGMLQLGANWGADPAILETLRQELAEQTETSTAAIILTPAPVMISDAALKLFDERGQSEQLAISTTSNSPPFNAIFNLQIRDEPLNLVRAAIHGRKEILKVVYRGSIFTEATVEVLISGDASFAITELVTSTDKQRARHQVEQGITAKHFEVKVTTEHWDIPNDIINRVVQDAMNKAAEMLIELTQDTDRRARTDSWLRASASITQAINMPASASTDIGSWFSGRQGAEHIRIVQSVGGGETTHPPELKSLEVKLAVVPEGAPIAYIRIAQGNNGVNLTPPPYESKTLQNLAVDKPVTVTTQYTDGSPAFEYSIDNLPMDELTLNGSHLGLTHVVVDGSSLQQKGAKKARVVVRFIPADHGNGEGQMFYFRGDQWTGSWWLVNPSQGLNGVFEYRCKETTADGEVIQHETGTTENPEIVIRYETV